MECSTFLLGGAADGEGMPLVLSNDRDLNEDVVAALVSEVTWSGQHQVGHLRSEREKKAAGLEG